jgi:hypothetical protein
MLTPDLHIVAFAVPYPPDYGGAIEVWNRLRALHKEGVKVSLHCFLYSHFLPQPAINAYVQEVHYYPRSIWPMLFTRGQPFGVTSRKSKALLARLQEDKSPVLFEGVQTTAWRSELRDRKLFLRAHNIEHQYYKRLAKYSSGLTSMMFNRESQCLEEYEINTATGYDAVFTISPTDQAWYEELEGKAEFVPPFHGLTEVTSEPGRGEYVLYQGDLSIDINQEAILEILRKVGFTPEMPLVIAGKAGDSGFESKLTSFPNIRRESNVSQDSMSDIVRKAQVILIHSLHAEGMKLKLFPALYRGRFVAANPQSRTETSLDDALHMYTPETLPDVLDFLYNQPFTQEEVAMRQFILGTQPSDQEKARQIIRYL